MEDTAKWHHHVPSEAEYTMALQELEQAEILWRETYVHTS
jgi:hypothetical protein